jgi:methionyl aminopeptidase
MISIKSSREIEYMRQTCALAASTLDYVADKIHAGMSTLEVNDLCHQYIIDHKAYPSPLNYHGFPKSVCTSRNEVVCHGIPSSEEMIKDGDIFNLDVTTYLNSFHGDTNRTFFIGNVSEEARKLVEVTYECMMLGIKEVRPGARLGNVGAAIEEYAKDLGYGVVEEFCGHGIGRQFHEDPQVLHYGTRQTGVMLKAGMTFTIEPMINLGTKHCRVLKDGWTAVTRDGKLSAQFEHTILVTNDGFEILTLSAQEKLGLKPWEKLS